MNHNKVHNKVFVLLTLPFKKLMEESMPAIMILAFIAGASYLPIPSIFNLWSCLVALLVLLLFNLYIYNNGITFDVKAVEEAPVVEKVEESKEEPKVDDIVLGVDVVEEVKEEPTLSSVVDIVEVPDLDVDFGINLSETYARGDVKEMANAGANKTRNKAEFML